MAGFDDLPFSEISTPALTTLRVPNREMGKWLYAAFRDDRGDRTDAVIKTQVCPKIVYRNTVKKL